MFRGLPAVLLVVGFVLFLPTVPQKVERPLLYELDNGCLIYALHMKMVLDANERLNPYMWTRILAIEFADLVVGHAVLVFVYKNMTFIYDPARGSYVAARYPLYDPLSLAEIGYPRLRIKKAMFLEPTLTLHYPYKF